MALSVASPLEVRMRSSDVCADCQTQDCLRGNAAAPGCGTGLFMPKKVGNLDCTFCLDCVSACPHDNIGLLTRVPLTDIAQVGWRSSIGVLAKRMDFMVLIAVIAVGGFANAIAMTEPALAFVQDCSVWMGGNFLAVMCVVLASIIAIALPMVVASLIGSTSRADIRLRFSHMTLSLLPLSIAMWLAHLGFHFVTGFRSALPPLQRAAQDLGVNGLGSPQWSENCCSIMPAWLVPAQFMILGAGLLVSLSLMWSRAERSIEPDIRTSLPTMFAVARRGFIGMLASLCWWAIGVWIVLQPMQMRGLLNS
jgi:ferredoxin